MKKSLKTRFYRLSLFIFSAGLLMVAACQRGHHSPVSPIGSGALLRETRNVGVFDSVEMRTACHLFFSQGAGHKLHVEAEDHILPLIHTYVRPDRTLVIESLQNFDSSAGVKVYASMRDIRGFSIFGAGAVESQSSFSCRDLRLKLSGAYSVDMDVDADRIFTEAIGAGAISLRGRAEYHKITLSGAGVLRSADLDTLNSTIVLNGAGSASVRVRGTLDVTINGAGIVYYTGAPTNIRSQVYGAGQLVNLN
ncbi:head GIN domain-containing protein [Acidobacteriota bacterium]